MSRIHRACAGGVSAAALVAGSLVSVGVVGGGAASATLTERVGPGDSAECPEAFPADELTVDLPVTGLTTAGTHERDGVPIDSSTTPEEFTGTYQATLEDPSGDLFVFKVSGSRITNSDGTIDAGIWAGISGSPLYAADGRLVGSVSYSFSGLEGSVYAGVTPADDLYDLLGENGETTTPPARVALSKGEQQELVRRGVPAAAAQQGLHRLTPETTLGGMRSARSAALARIAKRFGRSAPAVLGGGSAQDVEVPIVPGSNFANVDSFGTISLYGVGTTTAVCGDLAIAYGHPAAWAPHTQSVHGAVTALIQKDGAGSYKIANLAAPAGTLVADRLNGIVGQLGVLPDTTEVSSTTTGPHPRQSLSHVPNAEALSYVVANQTYLDTLLTLDRDAGGTASLTWRLDYQRADGSTGVFERGDRYATTSYLADLVTYDVASDIDAILRNRHEEVTITDVSITEKASPVFKSLKVGSVEMRSAAGWTKLKKDKVATIKPGRTIKVRVNLVPSSRESKATKVSHVVSFKVPKKAAGKARLSVLTSGVNFDDYFEAFSARRLDRTGLPGLLDKLRNRPRQDAVRIQFKHAVKGSKKMKSVTKNWQAPAVTTGRLVAKLKAERARR